MFDFIWMILGMTLAYFVVTKYEEIRARRREKEYSCFRRIDISSERWPGLVAEAEAAGYDPCIKIQYVGRQGAGEDVRHKLSQSEWATVKAKVLGVMQKNHPEFYLGE